MNISVPFFVIGNHRSGTTLLRLMLASHPRLFVPPETGFVVLLSWLYRTDFLTPEKYEPLIEDLVKTENWEDMGISREEIEAEFVQRQPKSFRSAMELIYILYGKKYFPGSERWGDKTTWYVDQIPLLSNLFPESQFIHLIRDGRDVACSYLNTSHMDHSITRIAKRWVKSVKSIRNASKKYLSDERYLEVFYEKLVANPEVELKRICNFLGEKYRDEMLEYWKKNRSHVMEPQRHLGWKEKTLHPVSTDSIGVWKTQLNNSQKHIFNRIAMPALIECEYKCESKLSLLSKLLAPIELKAFIYYWNLRQKLRPIKVRWRNKRIAKI